ncbi:MAG: type VI secretion system membrane subunit TssM [Candidatus Eisenbacteria bacterium]
MLFSLLLKLMNPATLLSGGAIGLAALAILIGRSFGWPWYLTLIVVLSIVILYVVVLFIVKTVQAKKAKALEQSIEQQAQAQIATTRPGREGEIEHLKSQLLEAVEALKKSKLGKSKGGEGALYVLPWYMIIGPPAAGKTTLLQNGGLNFPYLDPARSRSSVKGVGGTRNCDWWFAEEAVILDTAGRYVLPVEADDTKEWFSFLDLLRKYRGKQPINGLIVGVSISDLLAGGEESVDEHAVKIRTRIDELIKQLGVTFPVYVLFTKCDLIKGFVEFFGDFSKTERAAVWGATVARDRAQGEPAQRIFEEEFDRLVESVHEMKVPRVAQLGKPDGRPEVMFFPLQIAALRSRLSRFVQVLFRQNPYQELPVFRGFYLTSGTQEGRPIDQVINAMLKGMGVPSSDEGMYVQPSQTKSYFIEEVFSKIAFPDRFMGGPSVAGERRRRLTRIRFFSVGCIGLGILALLLGILSSLNGALVRRVEDLSGRAKASVEGSERNLPLADLRTLDELRGGLEQMERRKGFGSKLALLGTYQGESAEAAARNLYLYVLYEKAMAPALPFLAARLRDANAQTPFVEYYDSYRAWSLILDPAMRLKGPADAPRTALVLGRFWSSRNGESEAEVDTLLTRQLLYAARFPTELAALVSERPDLSIDQIARGRIRDYWSADAVYPSLVHAGGTAADITVEGAAGGEFGLTGATTVPRLHARWVAQVRQADLGLARGDAGRLGDAGGLAGRALAQGRAARSLRRRVPESLGRFPRCDRGRDLQTIHSRPRPSWSARRARSRPFSTTSKRWTRTRSSAPKENPRSARSIRPSPRCTSSCSIRRRRSRSRSRGSAAWSRRTSRSRRFTRRR